MLKLYLFLIVFFFCNGAFTQSKISLSGTVTNPQGNPLTSVIVTYKRTNVPGTITALTDSKGSFSLSIPDSGAYMLQAALLGYEKFTRSFKRVDKGLGILHIKLTAAVNRLKEVTISEKRPLTERRTDRIIYNVSGSITARGSSVWEALGKAPGVIANFDNGVSLNGKNAGIYINGKPSRLSGEDLANYLRNLPADNVSRIELMTNPPAEFDAQGGTVINIIIKKLQGDGLDNTLSSGFTQGKYSRYSVGDVFNYRNGKLNIYGNYGYRSGKTARIEDEYIVFSAPGNYSDWQDHKSGYRDSRAHTYELGADYNLNKRNVVGLLIDGYNSSSDRPNNILTQIYNNHRTTPDSLLQTTNLTRGLSSLYTFNLNYKGQLDTAGQSIGADIDYTPYRNSNSQLLSNSTVRAADNSVLSQQSASSIALQDIAIFAVKLDYAKPLNKDWKLSAGLKYSSITNKNSLNYFSTVNSSFINDSTKSNQFNYTEKTTAEYFKASGKTGKFSFQAGLRAEYTKTEGNSITLNSRTGNDYFKLFPSLYADYAIDANNSLNAYYGYRISRPEYIRLNPFKYYSSPYTYLEGNPYLRPAFNYTYELGYVYKDKYPVTLFYYKTDGAFSNITVQDNVTKIFYDTQQNLDKSIQAGLYSSLPFTLSSWWTMENYLRLTYRNEASAYLQGAYNYHLLSCYLSSGQSFSISKAKNWNAELNLWYASSSIQGIYKQRPRSDVSAGMSKSILHGQGTLRLSANDIFYGNRYKLNVNYLNQINGFTERNDTQNLSLSFSYRMGNKKVQKSRERTTSSQDEKNRTNK